MRAPRPVPSTESGSSGPPLLTVDSPTTRPLDEVIAAFDALPKPLTNNSELNDFLATYFGKAGTELVAVPPAELSTDPGPFMAKINDSVIREYTKKVMDIWPDLTRSYVGAGNCTGCVNSFIPLNHTFVVVRRPLVFLFFTHRASHC